jgi:hypothetical protein
MEAGARVGARELPMNAMAPADRATAIRDFGAALAATRGFSFVRLGDGELRFMLECQRGITPTAADRVCEAPSIEYANVHSGLTARDYLRLRASFERATWVDVYLNQAYNAAHLAELEWQRDSRGVTVSDPAAGGFILSWIDRELPHYLRGHRTLWCGAEVPLLQALLRDPAYRQASRGFFPPEAAMFFESPPAGGRELSRDLDALIAHLAERVRAEEVDTVFLALGGLAKIVAVELAAATGVRTVDIGGALRGLCYAGSDGHTTWRASHHPHFFRVPLEVYWRALRAAQPELSAAARVAKAHAQLALELHRREPGATTSADVHDHSAYDPSPENVAAFSAGLRFYHRYILPGALLSPVAWTRAVEFVWWRWKKGLGADGRAFQAMRGIFGRRTAA